MTDVPARPCPTLPARGPVHDRIAHLLATYPIIDGHNDLPWEAREQVGYDWSRFDLAAGVATVCTDLPRLRTGRVGAQFWSVYVPSTWQNDRAVAATLEQIDAVYAMVEAFPADLVLARDADDIEDAASGRRIASLLGAEGGQSIGCSLGALRMLAALGVRYLTLTHNDNLPWAGSATDIPVEGGLTAFGHEVVRELNRLGMLVDLSHVATNTMHAALDTTAAPVIFSHSSARAVCDHPRNVPDDVLLRLRDQGGVCMVTFVPEFLSPDTAAWREEAGAAAIAAGVDPKHWWPFQHFATGYAKDHPKPPARVADLVAHCEHIREVAGIDHLGIGGDYDGTDTFPEEMPDVAGYPRLFEALAEAGWSDSDLAKVARSNTLRVMRDVEAIGRRLRAERGPSLKTFAELDAPS